MVRNFIECHRLNTQMGSLSLGLYKSHGGWGSTEEGGLVGPRGLSRPPVNLRTGTCNVLFGTPALEPVKRGDPGWFWDGERIWMNGFDDNEGIWIENTSR